MFTKPNNSRTLERADPRQSILQNDLVIRIIITTLIILAIIIFLIVCFILVPPTYGYYHW